MSESGVNSFVKQMLDSKLENDRTAFSAAGRSVGSMLAAARMEKEWTVQQVADQLKLSTKQIIALEDNKFDDLPKLVIVRGFVRTYAKLLKIDADILIALLPKEVENTHLQETLKPALSTPFMESRLSLMGRQDSNKKYILGAALLVLFAAGFFVIQKTNVVVLVDKFFKGQTAIAPDSKVGTQGFTTTISEIVRPNIENQVATSSETLAPAVTILESEKAKAQSIVAQSNQVTPQVNSVAVPTGVIKDSPTALPMATPTVAAMGSVDKDMMKLKFRQDSWIQVRKENGAIVTSHLAKAGTEEVFSVKELLQVKIGNAAGVEGILRGAPLVIQAEKGSNVVNLNVK